MLLVWSYEAAAIGVTGMVLVSAAVVDLRAETVYPFTQEDLEEDPFLERLVKPDTK